MVYHPFRILIPLWLLLWTTIPLGHPHPDMDFSMFHSPFRVIHILVSCLVSSTGHELSKILPLSWSTSFEECISSHAPSSIPLHVSFLFLLPFPHTSLLTCLLRYLFLYVPLLSHASAWCTACPSLLLPFLKHIWATVTQTALSVAVLGPSRQFPLGTVLVVVLAQDSSWTASTAPCQPDLDRYDQQMVPM